MKKARKRNPLRQVQTLIEVVEADIDRGVAQSCWRCPVALALSRVLKKGERYDVHHFAVIIRDQGYRLPKRATKFIEQFDNACDVKPFQFRLPIPADALLPSVLRRNEKSP